MSTITNWYELWADESLSVPYVMVLRPSTASASRFEILDLAEMATRVFEADTYEEARMWLLEDEYVLVGKRQP